ncbi:MAG: beta-ketoacyl-ACP synthase II [Anaerolineales bacterium]|nr:beta-ketoacyl-ACP synthase II [Anaerolineales bacterium]MCS7246871.1 beta-ketoacyl-ACP synthase II [Anaerolineales bacterium]MDW8160682.1 beta-ketoacyl-ACP synthase II [Anaerolineales bacterium]MDW8448331.1 beta-ketoacyl-ACP synthase II [Anaerolineales bacterium]
MRRRVVVTGLGCVSPVGNDIPTLWASISQGISGINYITQFDPSEHKSKIAAEVKNFDGVALFGSREARRMDRYTQFALASAQQALEQAQLAITDQNRDRIGVVIGTGIGGIHTLIDQFQVFLQRGPNRVSPFLVPMMLPDSAGSMVAIHFGLRGPNLAVITACATGNNAIGEATEMIRRGQADVMLAGGSEAAILPVAMAGMSVMGALSTRNDDPPRASRPFDLHRDGFVMGEGAAVLVLEELEFAKARRANILAEVSGYGHTNDAYHVSAPAEDGYGAVQCMRQALADARLETHQINYINAHGTSTPLNDKIETQAIKTVFGERAYEIPVSSTKSMTGHLLGASGALEAVICVLALQHQFIPPTINYETPDPECDLDYVPNLGRAAKIDHILSNSFGFGGHNASIVFSRFVE